MVDVIVALNCDELIRVANRLTEEGCVVRRM